MDVLIIVTTNSMILAIGFFTVLSKFRGVLAQHNLAVDYYNKLGEYVQTKGKNNDLYSWLMQNAVQIQATLGQLGVIAYKPAHVQGYWRNYPVFINLIPEIQSLFLRGDWDEAFDNTKIVADTLLRFIGVMDQKLNGAETDRRNPLVWYREGVKTLIIIPIAGLQLLLGGNAETLRENRLIGIIAGLIGLLGILSSVIQVVLGWDQFTQWIFVTLQSVTTRVSPEIFPTLPSTKIPGPHR